MVEKELIERSPEERLKQYLEEKINKIKEAAIVLNVYRKDSTPEQLLNSVLDELGDEGEDDDESTFFEKVERMEDILYSIDDFEKD